MTNDNKVLKVSYGTFSCTLEGFDDSFGMMKTIAEYFRDLAADDPSFGAEPSKPDPEVLAQIAERRVAHRVEAREDEGRILVKAHDTEPAQQDAPEAETPAMQAEEAAPETEARTAPTSNAPAPDTTDAPLPAADKPEPLPQSDVNEAIPEQDACQTAEAFFANSPTPSETDAEMEAEANAPATFEPFDAEAAEKAADSIAARLQRIREVVSQQGYDTYDDEIAEPEDGPTTMPFDRAAETAKEEPKTTDTPLSEAVAEIEEALEDDAQTATGAAARDTGDEDLSAILDRPEATDTREGGLPAEGDAQTRLDKEAESLFTEDRKAGREQTAEEDPAPVSEADAQADGQIPGVKGRVLKVDRADLEAALDAGDLEEFDSDQKLSLTDAQEADLQRALDVATADVTPPETGQTPAHSALPSIDTEAAEDVSRLMAEADQQMEEPEGATRRNAFAHLRAAVAARFADKTMYENAAQDETSKPYRSDLAEAVKPRRPVSPGAHRERPAEPRSTLLRLVAEQRVDAGKPAVVDPVMPRRVAATPDDDQDFAEDIGFAAFAEQSGATKLPDVLEAAAAYLTFVEGHEQFSRPQLMTRVRQVESADFNRADGLRVFGQLLRAGKIEKGAGGYFSVSDTIGFRPDERAAG